MRGSALSLDVGVAKRREQAADCAERRSFAACAVQRGVLSVVDIAAGFTDRLPCRVRPSNRMTVLVHGLGADRLGHAQLPPCTSEV